jgi:hypothetical protein
MVNKKSSDVNVTAFEILKAVTGEPSKKPTKPPIPVKNPAAVALGRLGGLKGGKARATALSSARRKQIAKNAALKRWKKH